jgi:hypothetical protein
MQPSEGQRGGLRVCVVYYRRMVEGGLILDVWMPAKNGEYAAGCRVEGTFVAYG